MQVHSLPRVHFDEQEVFAEQLQTESFIALVVDQIDHMPNDVKGEVFTHGYHSLSHNLAVAVGVCPCLFVDWHEPLLAVTSMVEIGGVDTTWCNC